MPMNRNPRNKYLFYQEDLGAQEAIDSAITQFIMTCEQIMQHFPNLGVSDTLTKEAIAREVLKQLYEIPLVRIKGPPTPGTKAVAQQEKPFKFEGHYTNEPQQPATKEELKRCRYCEHMKDHANGQTGVNAYGFDCELHLHKNDSTAATCLSYKEPEKQQPAAKESVKIKVSDEVHKTLKVVQSAIDKDERRIAEEGREHDATEDLPHAEEDRHDYLEESGPQE